MGRIYFDVWEEFVAYIKKVGVSRVIIYVCAEDSIVMRPAVQSRIDSAVFSGPTDGQISDITALVPEENTFHVAVFEWQEDRTG
jgi:hypothetical protein